MRLSTKGTGVWGARASRMRSDSHCRQGSSYRLLPWACTTSGSCFAMPGSVHSELSRAAGAGASSPPNPGALAGAPRAPSPHSHLQAVPCYGMN